MNVHHLELFYYVARHEGITEAVRKMPYGIQQPAVSGQILQLEKFLGVRLFQRRPFALTPAGSDLYDFIYPFFSRLDQVAERLKGEESQHLRLAASGTVMAHHLPEVLRELRGEYPKLRLTLRQLVVGEMEAALRKQEADIAVTIHGGKSGPGIKSAKLLELPLVLLAPEDWGLSRFRDVVSHAVGGQITCPLLSLPRHEPISCLFQDGLKRRKLVWEPTMEVSELQLIRSYVGHGFGCGVGIDIPGVDLPDGIMKIRLPSEFSPLAIGVQYGGQLKPVAERFVAIAAKYAKQLEGGDKS